MKMGSVSGSSLYKKDAYEQEHTGGQKNIPGKKVAFEVPNVAQFYGQNPYEIIEAVGADRRPNAPRSVTKVAEYYSCQEKGQYIGR